VPTHRGLLLGRSDAVLRGALGALGICRTLTSSTKLRRNLTSRSSIVVGSCTTTAEALPLRWFDVKRSGQPPPCRLHCGDRLRHVVTHRGGVEAGGILARLPGASFHSRSNGTLLGDAGGPEGPVLRQGFNGWPDAKPVAKLVPVGELSRLKVLPGPRPSHHPRR